MTKRGSNTKTKRTNVTVSYTDVELDDIGFERKNFLTETLVKESRRSDWIKEAIEEKLDREFSSSSASLSASHSTSCDVDYEKIRSIIKEELSSIEVSSNKVSSNKVSKRKPIMFDESNNNNVDVDEEQLSKEDQKELMGALMKL